MPLNGYIGGIVDCTQELEAVYAVRMTVFVEEQNVPAAEELDAYDLTAIHFFSRHIESGAVVATARFLDKGGQVGKIGRVAVLKEFREQGIGADIMHMVEEYALVRGFVEIILEAQLHAIPFYERLGYIAEGDVYLDCEIEHRVMRRAL